VIVSGGSTQGGGVFELTVEGSLGPVLRWALRPRSVDESHTCTTIRTTARSDLPGIVELLEHNGLVIEGVWLLTPGGVAGPDGTLLERE
jgi:hypothetical protein